MNMRYVSHEMDKTARYLTVSIRGPWWKLWRRVQRTVYKSLKGYECWKDLDTGEEFGNDGERLIDGIWNAALQRDKKLELLLGADEDESDSPAYKPGMVRKLRALNGGK